MPAAALGPARTPANRAHPPMRADTGCRSRSTPISFLTPRPRPWRGRSPAMARARSGWKSRGGSPRPTVDLARIRQSRLRVLASIVADVNRDDAANDDGTSEFDDQAIHAGGVGQAAGEGRGRAQALDRYERRALSRRKTAGRRLLLLIVLIVRKEGKIPSDNIHFPIRARNTSSGIEGFLEALKPVEGRLIRAGPSNPQIVPALRGRGRWLDLRPQHSQSDRQTPPAAHHHPSPRRGDDADRNTP